MKGVRMSVDRTGHSVRSAWFLVWTGRIVRFLAAQCLDLRPQAITHTHAQLSGSFFASDFSPPDRFPSCVISLGGSKVPRFLTLSFLLHSAQNHQQTTQTTDSVIGPTLA
jgi:hypothetical protein